MTRRDFNIKKVMTAEADWPDIDMDIIWMSYAVGLKLTKCNEIYIGFSKLFGFFELCTKHIREVVGLKRHEIGILCF